MRSAVSCAVAAECDRQRGARVAPVDSAAAGIERGASDGTIGGDSSRIEAASEVAATVAGAVDRDGAGDEWCVHSTQRQVETRVVPVVVIDPSTEGVVECDIAARVLGDVETP